ncbi:MAG: hypothetical protein M1151_01590 [Candidatus Thermoplasmatota archaeon]|nr:hypothetical protein [Candidatus Thermoplasmatota archaeon]
MTETVSIVARKGDELLVHVSECIKINSRVLSITGKEVGKVIRIMGPTTNPSALIKVRDTGFDAKEVVIKC